MPTLSDPVWEKPATPAVLSPDVKPPSFTERPPAEITIFVLLPGTAKPCPVQVARRASLGDLRNKIAVLLGAMRLPEALSIVHQGRSLRGLDTAPVHLSAMSQVHVCAGLPGGKGDQTLTIKGLDGGDVSVNFN